MRTVRMMITELWQDAGTRWFAYMGLFVLVFCLGLYLGGVIMGRHI